VSNRRGTIFNISVFSILFGKGSVFIVGEHYGPSTYVYTAQRNCNGEESCTAVDEGRCLLPGGGGLSEVL
jgi:hypothetical protein